jgi:hypothetical protein
MDPRDLFKGNPESGESGYDDIASASFGMFKSNFFSRSQSTSEEGAGPAKQAFGEITLENVSSQDLAESNEGEKKGVKDLKDEVHTRTDESSVKEHLKDPSPHPSVPSYLAQLDVGVGNDLQIESAFGSLTDDGKDASNKDGKKGEESQARKLPSMFGLGF